MDWIGGSLQGWAAWASWLRALSGVEGSRFDAFCQGDGEVCGLLLEGSSDGFIPSSSSLAAMKTVI